MMVNYPTRTWVLAGFILLVLAELVGFLMIQMGIIQMDKSPLWGPWVVTHILATLALYLADERLKIAVRREELEQFLGSVRLLESGQETSKLAGVCGLIEILLRNFKPQAAPDKEQEPAIQETAIIARTILWDVLQVGHFLFERSSSETRRAFDNRNIDQRSPQEARRKGAIIKALCRASRVRKDELDFSGLNLFKVELNDMNLSGANFSGSLLSGANLSGADLSETDLSKVRFWGFPFDKSPTAKTPSADLSNAVLSKANLSGAFFKGVKGLETINAFDGIWAYRGMEPTGLPENLMAEVQENLRKPK